MEDHVQVRAVDVARAWEERCVMYEVARSFCQSVGVWVHVKVSWVTGGGCSAALARTVSKATIALEARERSAGRWASSCTTQSCNRVDTDAIVVVVDVTADEQGGSCLHCRAHNFSSACSSCDVLKHHSTAYHASKRYF